MTLVFEPLNLDKQYGPASHHDEEIEENIYSYNQTEKLEK
jgi:hypothetical protein